MSKGREIQTTTDYTGLIYCACLSTTATLMSSLRKGCMRIIQGFSGSPRNGNYSPRLPVGARYSENTAVRLDTAIPRTRSCDFFQGAPGLSPAARWYRAADGVWAAEPPQMKVPRARRPPRRLRRDHIVRACRKCTPAPMYGSRCTLCYSRRFCRSEAIR